MGNMADDAEVLKIAKMQLKKEPIRINEPVSAPIAALSQTKIQKPPTPPVYNLKAESGVIVRMMDDDPESKGRVIISE
jgi:hypothetical protein